MQRRRCQPSTLATVTAYGVVTVPVRAGQTDQQLSSSSNRADSAGGAEEAYKTRLLDYLHRQGGRFGRFPAGEMPLTILGMSVERPTGGQWKILPLLREDARFALREGLPLQWFVAAAPSAAGPPRH